MWSQCRYRFPQVLAELTTTNKNCSVNKSISSTHSTLSFTVNAEIPIMFTTKRALSITKKATLKFIAQSSFATFAPPLIAQTFFSKPATQATTTSFSQFRKKCSHSDASRWVSGNDCASRASGSRSYSCFDAWRAPRSRGKPKRGRFVILERLRSLGLTKGERRI